MLSCGAIVHDCFDVVEIYGWQIIGRVESGGDLQTWVVSGRRSRQGRQRYVLLARREAALLGCAG
jgi:hypothetical protein